MAKLIVKKEALFAVPDAHIFAIGASESGYTLNYSVDGENFNAWGEATEADEIAVVTNAPFGLVFKLAGNTSDLLVIW